MQIVINILIGLIAAEHLYILYIEMFAWETVGKKTFRSLPQDLFAQTKTLAANQGLYNGFLAAGLIWALCIGDDLWARNVSVFFLGCVAVAGLYGAWTAGKSIFFKQALPAMVALALIAVDYLSH